MTQDYFISQLNIYPIKGLGGIAVSESLVAERGFKFDRRYMLIDENNQFISQRSFSILCLFKMQFCDDGFMVSFKNEFILLPFNIQQGQSIQVKIWEDEVTALVANENINKFFRKHLSLQCKLVYMPDASQRLVDKNFVSADNNVSFADGYPVLIIGQQSLNLLNAKLDESIEMNRFRPNIVFEGGVPHEEDGWYNFNINGVKFNGVKPCARCQVPTINQLTAEQSKEPLKTLATYRNFNHKINFGQNIIVLNTGKISIGDKILFEK